MASVSSCGKTRLLVPLSKMMVRDCLSVEVDLPLTVIPDEVSCQKPSSASTKGMNVTEPKKESIVRMMGRWQDICRLTTELGGVDSTESKLSITNRFRCEEQTEQRRKALGL